MRETNYILIIYIKLLKFTTQIFYEANHVMIYLAKTYSGIFSKSNFGFYYLSIGQFLLRLLFS